MYFNSIVYFENVFRIFYIVFDDIVLLKVLIFYIFLIWIFNFICHNHQYNQVIECVNPIVSYRNYLTLSSFVYIPGI